MFIGSLALATHAGAEHGDKASGRESPAHATIAGSSLSHEEKDRVHTIINNSVSDQGTQ